MTTAFVLGNGISRRSINLELLKLQGTVYGCNALYRDFVPDILVATDRPIATEIQQSGYAAKHKFYTRRPIAGHGARTVPHEYFGFSSGPIALGLAAQDKHSEIYFAGFDMGPTDDNKFNNIYADSEFYKTSLSTPTYTGNWIKQIRRVITDYPATQFYRIMGPTTAKIAEFEQIKNLVFVDLDTFLDRINSKKDL
jgi:hypothetical protein